METINVVSYQRVSTKKQETERQQKEVLDYCNYKNYNLISEFTEKESGLKEERKELTNLLNFVKDKKNKVEYVIITELTRIGRTREVLNTIDILHSLKIGLICLKDNITSLNSDKTENATTKMMLGILSSQSEYEVDVIKNRMKSGRVLKTSLGYYMNNSKYPFGYMIDEKRLIINPVEASIIQEIVEMFLAGSGTFTIAKYLNQKGIATRSKKKWYPAVIYQILKNENLIGKRIYNDVEYSCPAILDQKTFDKIQERLKNKTNKQGINKKHEYLFDKKIIKCGICNKSYYPTLRKAGTQSVYSCTSNIYPAIKCGNRGIGIAKLENSITDYILTYFSEVIVNQLKEQNFNSDILELNNKLNEKNIFLVKEKKKESLLLYNLLNENITQEMYNDELKPVKKEILNLNLEIDKISKNLDEINEIVKKQTDILEIENLLKTDKANSKKYIRSIIDQITIFPELNKKMSTYSNDHSFRIVLKIQRQFFTLYLSQRSKNYEPVFKDYAKYKEFFKEYEFEPILLNQQPPIQFK